MKRYQILLIGILLSSNMCFSQNYTREDVYKAWNEEDINKLVLIHSKSTDLRSLTEEAIMSMNIRNSDLSFEDLHVITELLVGDEPLYGLFTTAFQEKKSQTLQNVVGYTPEQLEKYMTDHPIQRNFIESEMRKAINSSLTSLPLDELYYVARMMPYTDSLQIKEEAVSRHQERKEILTDRLSEYMKEERDELSYLLFILKTRSYEYFCRRFRNVCVNYACISQVPYDISDMTYQYRNIINNNLIPSEIQKYLQKEADAICAVINSSRAKYCAAMGKTDYVKLVIKIPAPDYSATIPTTSLYEINKAYEDYNDSRKAISTVGSIAKFFGAGLLASIGESIAEVMAGDGLTDKITSARLGYVKDSYEALEKSVKDNIAYNQNLILKQIATNQRKFIENAK